jgi:predicted RNA methylase
MTEPTAAKRGKLVGGAISDEVLDSSASVVRSTGKGTLIGLQQYFSPREASQLAQAVFCPYERPLPVLDPTAGNGALLEAFTCRYGIEVDPDHAKAANYTAIQGDLQRVYPLLRLAGVEFPAVVLNPPFGMDWKDDDGKTVNSMLQTYRYAVGLLDECGQGMMIAARERYWREIAPEATGAYAVIDCEDMFDGVEIPTVIVFFVHPDALDEDPEPPLALRATRSELTDLAEQVRDARDARVSYVRAHANDNALKDAFATVALEHRRRVQAEQGKASRYDLAARGQTLACHLSAFAKVALANSGLVRNAEGLNGKSVHYFALNLREWRQISAAAEEGLLTIDPELPGQVERVVHGAVRAATPLYPVKPQMRLGFLVEDLETLRCIRSDSDREYLAGERYPLYTATKVLKQAGEKVVQLRDGTQDVRATLRERHLLEVRVGRHTFDESKDSIEYLLEHFAVPDPGDIATRFPNEYQRAIAVIRSIETEYLTPRELSYKPFQVDDLARLLVKGSGPLGWDTGLGKTLGQLTWALACVRYWGCQDATLFVMPQDLLPQFQEETLKFFGRTVELIKTQADAKRIDRHVRRGGSGWYATYYEALSIVGRKDKRLPTYLMLPPGEQRYIRRRLEEDGEPSKPRMLNSHEFCPKCLTDTRSGWNGSVCENCHYVHKALKVRSIGSLLAVTFRRAIICVDELTEMQGDDSLRGKAVRGLRCRHALGGTATMISNYVNSCFFGMWWCCGNASARFPFSVDDKPQFERDFCVIEHTFGDPEKNEGHVRKRRKILPEVTNLSVIWRLLSTNMVRRRKEDCGEDIVPRYFKPVKVPAGVAQLAHHKQVLQDFVRWFEATHPDSPLVKNGLVEQFAAGCGMLPKLDYAATMPEADPDHAWWGIPSSNWTPTTLKVLELALQHVRNGEKVMIGSSLVETGPWLAARLSERGARAVHITEQRDGKATTMSPQKRAAALKDFRHGLAQVLCTGVKAVKFGHNLPEVSVVILHGPPWTYLEVKQYVDRAWRLTSTKPINVYIVYTSGLLGERKKQLVNDKGAASDLTLDGQLIEAPEPEINWNDELRKMRAVGIEATGDEVPESEIHALWMRAEGPFEPIATPDVNVIALPLAATPPPTSAPDGEDAVVITLPKRAVTGEAESWETDVEPGEQTALFAA